MPDLFVDLSTAFLYRDDCRFAYILNTDILLSLLTLYILHVYTRLYTWAYAEAVIHKTIRGEGREKERGRDEPNSLSLTHTHTHYLSLILKHPTREYRYIYALCPYPIHTLTCTPITTKQ